MFPMPFGGTEVGFMYFTAAKLAGYTAYCHWAIEPQIAKLEVPTAKIPAAWKAGAVRTLIGLGIGAVVGLSFWKIPYFSHSDGMATYIFFAFLIPVRVLEWRLLFRWVYGRFPLHGSSRSKLVGGGVVTSFALDALGILAAFVLPGGIWIC
jgi:hypothetical protein